MRGGTQMVEYKKVNTDKYIPEHIYCNLCGEEIVKADRQYFCDFMHVEKRWGYFSEKDGQTHSFDLCEKCYDSFIKTFKIPVTEEGAK